jgi:hypothetical protein
VALELRGLVFGVAGRRDALPPQPASTAVAKNVPMRMTPTSTRDDHTRFAAELQ